MNQAQAMTKDQSEAEQMLRDFFRAEMPHPWPSFRAPLGVKTSKTRARWGLSRSHIGLAASVLFLVAGLWAGSFFLRSDAQPNDAPIHKLGQRPPAPGKMFKEPPATTPVEPAKPDGAGKDRPFSFAYPPSR